MREKRGWGQVQERREASMAGTRPRATTLDNVTGLDADTKDACCDVTVTDTVTGLDSPGGSGLARTARVVARKGCLPLRASHRPSRDASQLLFP